MRSCRFTRNTLVLLASAFVLASAGTAFGDDDSKPGAKVIKTVPVSAGAGSNHVAINTKTNRIYIANSGFWFFPNSTGGHSLSVLDGNTDKIIATIPITSKSSIAPFGSGPAASAIDEETNTIYVTTNNGSLSIIDGGTNQIKSSFVFDTNNDPQSGDGGLCTQDIVFSKKTKKLYVVNCAKQIDVIDPKRQKVLKVIPDDNATFLAINQRTNTIYATQYWDGTVWAIDGDTDQVVNTITGVGQPAVPDDCYLPANNDCTNQSSGLDHIAVDEILNRAYVVGTNDSRFVTIDTKKNKVIDTKIMSINQYNVAVNSFTHAVYSLSDLGDALDVIDGTTGKLVAQDILVGSQPTNNSIGDLPQGIAVNPFTGKIYVADYGNFISNPEVVSQIVVLKAGEGYPWVGYR
jgi:DNA-binding beta-propeller fold protein YncE